MRGFGMQCVYGYCEGCFSKSRSIHQKSDVLTPRLPMQARTRRMLMFLEPVYSDTGNLQRDSTCTPTSAQLIDDDE